MSKKDDIRTIQIRNRKLELIEGLTIKKYLPKILMDNVHMALADQNMKWEDDVIEKCTMVITNGGHVSMIYDYEAIKFKGLLLFTFTESDDKGHRFSFALKLNHREMHQGRKYR